MVGHQIAAFGDEHAHLPDLELDPRQRQLRQQAAERALGLADFADQHTVLGEVQRRVAEDAQRQIQAVVARAQTELRLEGVFLRQRVGLVVGDVGRIGDDQVVVLALQAGEQVRLHEADILGVQARLVLGGEGQGVVADIDAIDVPFGIVMTHGDGDAARTGAQIQRAAHFAAAQPGFEARLDELGDRRPRHQRAGVGLEAETGEPGLAGEIGGGDAFLDPAQEQPQHVFLLGQRDPRLAVDRRQIVRQVQRMQGELGRLVEGVVVAVAEGETGRVETAGAVADQVDDRLQFVGHVGTAGARGAE